MSDNAWRSELRGRLVEASLPGGGWGYRPDLKASAEPTALGALAVSTFEPMAPSVDAALTLLATLQRNDGSVSVTLNSETPHWPTSLAILAWQLSSTARAKTFRPHVALAVSSLLETRGETSPLSPTVLGHDTTLVGWPWVVGTHSWLEPTSYAILALKAAEQSDHPRVREGVRLLLDRVLPEGGWNYGNTRVFDHVLRPFPGTTGIALAALADESLHKNCHHSLGYLEKALTGVRAPWSLGWGLMGLSTWGARPKQAEAWLVVTAKRVLNTTLNTLHASLLLLAGAGRCPLVPERPSP